MENQTNSISKNEQLAWAMYDEYCIAVGGKSFKGEDLPKSDKFFTDPNTKVQALGWLKAADAAIITIFNDLRAVN